MAEGWVMAVCDVCRLLDKDTTKKECFWCPQCQSHICRKDQHRWDRRARAAMKKEIT